MKLKHDCVRKTMLYLEKNLELNDLIMDYQIEIEKFSKEDITYTISKLAEAGYINAKTFGYDNLINYGISSITWNGHEFLDNIRDNNVWKNTKQILSSFSSTSLRMIENIASQVITNIISSKMNL